MNPTKTLPIPEAVITRLPLYLNAIQEGCGRTARESECTVTSIQLGEWAGVPSERVRKDLSIFGRFGRQGQGYSCMRLKAMLRRILGLDRTWSVALIGAGQLGRAVISYPGFRPEGFTIKAIFDSDRRRVNTTVHSLRVQPLARLPAAVRDLELDVAVVTVPDRVQETVDIVVGAGIDAILSYAPVTARVPEGVTIRRIDPILTLQTMTYFLSHPVRRTPADLPAAG